MEGEASFYYKILFWMLKLLPKIDISILLADNMDNTKVSPVLQLFLNMSTKNLRIKDSTLHDTSDFATTKS